MAENRQLGLADAGRYQIRIAARLDPRWASSFDGMSLAAAEDGSTVLSGPVADQAALHGVLTRIRDLGLPLVSLTRVGPDRPAAPPDSTPSSPLPTDRRRDG